MYSGWLIKMGNFIIPNSKISYDTYSAYINMQDLDPWTDANGYLHRQAVELKALKVEFESQPMLTDKQFGDLMKGIYSGFTDPTAKQGIITAYIPELDDYVTQMGYMADIQPSIYTANHGVIRYNAVRFAFIGGVFNG